MQQPLVCISAARCVVVWDYVLLCLRCFLFAGDCHSLWVDFYTRYSFSSLSVFNSFKRVLKHVLVAYYTYNCALLLKIELKYKGHDNHGPFVSLLNGTLSFKVLYWPILWALSLEANINSWKSWSHTISVCWSECISVLFYCVDCNVYALVLAPGKCIVIIYFVRCRIMLVKDF